MFAGERQEVSVEEPPGKRRTLARLQGEIQRRRGASSHGVEEGQLDLRKVVEPVVEDSLELREKRRLRSERGQREREIVRRADAQRSTPLHQRGLQGEERLKPGAVILLEEAFLDRL